MKTILLFVVLLSSFGMSAQLKTKVLKGKLGDSTLTYHQNGKISTIDFRSDSLFRVFTLLVFDNKGKEIFKGDHGYRHGGAGQEPRFYSNGQVSSVRSTFQPDGGIQYYDETIYFNEDGSFNRKEDHSMHTERETLMYTPPTKIEEPKEVKKVNQNTSVDSTDVIIKNSTRKKVSLIVANIVTGKIYVHKLKRNQELNIGKFMQVRGVLNPKNYFVVNLDANDPKAQNFSVVWISDVSTAKKSVLMLIDISELR